MFKNTPEVKNLNLSLTRSPGTIVFTLILTRISHTSAISTALSTLRVLAASPLFNANQKPFILLMSQDTTSQET